MYSGHRIAVVIPVYNEAAFIGQVLDTLPEFVDRVYVVDDCSTDGTWEIVTERATTPEGPAATVTAESTTDGGGSTAPPGESGYSDRATGHDDETAGPEICPISHTTNTGRGGAVKTGYRRALDDEMDIVAVMDGDGQMDPDRLHALLDPIIEGSADYAKGNRLAQRSLRQEMSRWRLFGNTLLTTLTRIVSGYWDLTDSQMGYTAITSDLLEATDIEALYDGYGFLNDMLVRLNVHGARIVDVPVPAWYGDEESGIRYSSFVPRLSALLAGRFLWRLRTEYGTTTHPVGILYGSAVASGLAGIATAVPVLALAGLSVAPVVPVVALSLCLCLVISALAAERRYNRDLIADVDGDHSI